MAISDWPDDERPRERLVRLGAERLSDSELLAIFLRTGVHGKTAVDLARELIAQYGGLRALLEADCKRFCAGSGLGRAKYAQLQAVLELGRRYLQEGLHRATVLTDPTSTRRYLAARLRGREREVFVTLFLDNRHRLIRCEELFQGTLDGASVHPREVVKQALRHNAAAVIFAHNHPSGIAEPSRADQQLTMRLTDALGLVDVRVLDHIIIGEGEAVSLAERGLM